MDEIDTEIYQESERIFGPGSPLLANRAVRCDKCGFKTGPCLWDISNGPFRTGLQQNAILCVLCGDLSEFYPQMDCFRGEVATQIALNALFVDTCPKGS